MAIQDESQAKTSHSQGISKIANSNPESLVFTTTHLPA